jgi:hypothetical protein
MLAASRLPVAWQQTYDESVSMFTTRSTERHNQAFNMEL